jgi:hypothetical protein
MQDTSTVARNSGGARPARRPVVDEELAGRLLGRAQAEGDELLGSDGLLSQETRAVLERALAEELTEHLCYEKHDPAGHGSGNSRNCSTEASRCPIPTRLASGADRAAERSFGQCLHEQSYGPSRAHRGRFMGGSRVQLATHKVTASAVLAAGWLIKAVMSQASAVGCSSRR